MDPGSPLQPQFTDDTVIERPITDDTQPGGAFQKTLLGIQREQTIALIVLLVYQTKGLDPGQLDIEALLDKYPDSRVDVS